MILTYLQFGVSVSVISWVVAIMLMAVLVKTPYYQELQSLNFLPSRSANRKIGIEYFRWVVRNTPFKFLNPGLVLRNGRSDLADIRNKMTYAEVSHLIGFLLVAAVAGYMGVAHDWMLGVMIMIPNVLLNLYPSLLQQANKRRLDRLIARGR